MNVNEKEKNHSIFVFLIFTATLLLFSSLNFLLINNSGGMALAGILSLVGLIIVLIILGLERFIVNIKGINMKYVWIIESVMISVSILYIIVFGISIG